MLLAGLRVRSNGSVRAARRGAGCAALVATLAVFLLQAPVARSAVPSTVFANHPHPISMAFNGNRLLVVGGDATATECSNVVTAYDTTGAASTFATLPDQPGCIGSELEDALYSVPKGLPGWQYGTTFVLRGSKIYALSQAGTVSLFANSGCTDGEIVDGTFDTVGTFGYQLIVSCASSDSIYTVSPTGVTTLVRAHLPYFGEGGAVVPSTFPSYGGQLLLPGENTGNIYALSPTGVVSTVGSWPGTNPEQILVVPNNPCTFGAGGGSLFTASVPGDIIERPASEFSLMGGDVLVADENNGGNAGGFGVMTGPGTPTPLDNPAYRSTYPVQYEDSVWAPCLSSDSSLSGLSPSVGSLTPTFSPTTTSYSETVANSVSAITVTPTSSDPGAAITVNGAPTQSGSASPSIPLSPGNNVIAVAVKSEDGSNATTYTVNVNRLGFQTAPQGSWVGQVGSGGYDLAGWNGSSDAVSLPGAVSSLSVAQGARFVWGQNTTDVRALQSVDQSTRTAATYYDPNEVRVVVNFGSAWSGPLNLYAVDWDSAGRRESITVNGQTVSLNSDFSQGAWVSVPISIPAGGGTVTITVDRQAGPNAVLSGIFLGGTGSPPPSTWSSAPQGTWVGQVGSGGYDLAGWNGASDAVSLPRAVSGLSLAQGARFVWGSTTDVRALQSPNQSTREAATYYDPNEVRVVVNFGSAWSGTLHLYAVDWDSAGRRESITVNGQTTFLNSDFSQGAWLTVPVSVAKRGTVTITADHQAGPNAVLSGIFFN